MVPGSARLRSPAAWSCGCRPAAGLWWACGELGQATAPASEAATLSRREVAFPHPAEGCLEMWSRFPGRENLRSTRACEQQPLANSHANSTARDPQARVSLPEISQEWVATGREVIVSGMRASYEWRVIQLGVNAQVTRLDLFSRIRFARPDRVIGAKSISRQLSLLALVRPTSI